MIALSSHFVKTSLNPFISFDKALIFAPHASISVHRFSLAIAVYSPTNWGVPDMAKGADSKIK
jgi:hypothetical protein